MDSRAKRVARIAGLFTACGFVLYGALRGEVSVVLNKAVNLCFECIGLG